MLEMGRDRRRLRRRLPRLADPQMGARTGWSSRHRGDVRRGAHLWILCAEPLPARLCRIYMYNLALRLDLPIKGAFKQVALRALAWLRRLAHA
jgi:hypothetical protein